MDAICLVHRLGLIDYEQAWQLQDRLAGEIGAGQRPPTLLLLEHPHTYTFGRKSTASNLLWDEALLAERHLSVHWVDRGGDVTYHGPGQLIGYPLLPLGTGSLREIQVSPDRPPQADYVGYLRRLESMLMEALTQLGVESITMEGLTGVWASAAAHARCTNCPPELRRLPAKLASIGVKVDGHGVSRHGFALNVAPDMSYWQGIIPCGIRDYPSASLAELMEPMPTMAAVIQAVLQAFSETFVYTLLEEKFK